MVDFPFLSFSFSFPPFNILLLFPHCESEVPFCEIPSLAEFLSDLDMVIGIESDGPVKTFAFKRMGFLESLFDMHLTLNELEEQAICKVGFLSPFLPWRKSFLPLSGEEWE